MQQASIRVHNSPLTDEAIEAAKKADAVLLGAIGGPEWGPSDPVRPEQGLLRLRKELGTYGNLRPCSFASEKLVDLSPLKADICRGTNFTIIRELTGGLYFGERKGLIFLQSAAGLAYCSSSLLIFLSRGRW